MVRRRLCAVRRKKAYLISIGVWELHINRLPGVARRFQERAFAVKVTAAAGERTRF
jgi:hypothetical protein